jgi:threonine/homoserine/homoserine lactone efflux protein
MSLELYLAFVGAVAVLMLIPGPNVALIVANAVAHGSRFGLLTVAGTSAAIVVQLGLTALGLAGLLGAFGFAFAWVRWAGVIYLVWLGIASWRAPAVDDALEQPAPRSARRTILRAFLVSLSNPKTLLFYGALFPQFISPSADVNGQIALLSATFLVLAIGIDSVWALAAGQVRRFRLFPSVWRDRVSGGLLIGAAAGLAFARSR